MAYTNFGFMRPGEEGDGNVPAVTPPVMPAAQRQQIAEEERQKYIAFMEHPSYKKRLLKEMFGREANPQSPEQQRALEQEYGQRVKTISSVPIKFKKIEDLGQTVPGEVEPKRIVLSEEGVMATNPEQFQDVIRHELGHAVNNALVGRGGAGTPVVEEIVLQQSRPGRKAMSDLMAQWSSQKGSWEKGEKQKAIQEATKEFGPEAVQKVLSLRSAADKELTENALNIALGKYQPKLDVYPEFNKIIDRNTFEAMYQSPTEAAARLGNIRRIAAEKFGHDLSEDFDIKKYGPQIEEFYKQKNVKSPIQDLKEQGYTDEAINEMMKYIARVPQGQQIGRYTG